MFFKFNEDMHESLKQLDGQRVRVYEENAEYYFVAFVEREAAKTFLEHFKTDILKVSKSNVVRE